MVEAYVAPHPPPVTATYIITAELNDVLSFALFRDALRHCQGSVDHVDAAAASQREEADPGRDEGQQVLRAPETEQHGGEEVARRAQVARGRDRHPGELPREGERYPPRSGGHAQRGGELLTTAPPTETISALTSRRLRLVRALLSGLPSLCLSVCLSV